MYGEAKKLFVVWRAQRDFAEKTSKFGLGGSVAQNENCGCIISYL
jgi:hypothetical protein